MGKKISIFCKAIAISLILFNSIHVSFAQGSPPQQGNNGHVSPNDGGGGPGEPPGGSGAPLDSNAIYVLLTGGLLFLLYANRKKVLTNSGKIN